MQIIKLLNDQKDLDYKSFQSRICNTLYPMLGVKIPILKKISQNLLNKYNYQDILNQLDNSYYETVMMQGIIIGMVKVSYQEKIKLINGYLPLIDCWAICDIFVATLKFIKSNQEQMLIYLTNLLTVDKEFYLRFVIVSLLTYYIDDNYYEDVLNILISIKSNYYYVKMAISWAYSVCIIKYFDKTIKFLKTNEKIIDKWTYNKALQKARESLQINVNQKELLNKLKRY